MPSAKEIRTKITSIKKTEKITSAMQMVAASKMRKTERQMLTSMPYAQKILEVMQHVASSHTQYKHPFLRRNGESTNVERIGYIVVASDRGLCGGLNINLFKKVLAEIQVWQNQEHEIDLCLFGGKAVSFFRYFNLNIAASLSRVGERPTVSSLIGGAKVMFEKYATGKMDKLFIAHNVFVSRMVQKPTITQLLPLTIPEDSKKNGYWDYIYETEPKIILDLLLNRYLETEIYQAVVDNVACEQAARMLAMKNATDNAEQILAEMQVIYNNARQAAITTEISEIIGGAEALD